VVVCPLCLIVPILISLLLLRYVIRLFETFGKVQVYDFMRFDTPASYIFPTFVQYDFYTTGLSWR